MFLLAAAVAGNGLKVVLSGEGADEAFLGYDIFKETVFRSRFDVFADDNERRREWRAQSGRGDQNCNHRRGQSGGCLSRPVRDYRLDACGRVIHRRRPAVFAPSGANCRGTKRRSVSISHTPVDRYPAVEAV